MAAAATARGTSWSRVVLPRCTRPGGRGRTPAVRAPRRSPAPDGSVKTRGRRRSPRAISAFDPSRTRCSRCSPPARRAPSSPRRRPSSARKSPPRSSPWPPPCCSRRWASSRLRPRRWTSSGARSCPSPSPFPSSGSTCGTPRGRRVPRSRRSRWARVGSILGTAVAYATVGRALGPDAWRVAACLCASYVGGSLNYAATAQALGLAAAPGGQAALAAGMAADNLAMAVFLSALMVVARRIPRRRKRRRLRRVTVEDGGDGIVGEIGGNEGARRERGDGSPRRFPRRGPPPAPSRRRSCSSSAVSSSRGVSDSRREPARCPPLVPVAAAAAATATRGALDASRAFAGSDAVGGALMLVFFAALGGVSGPARGD